MLMNKWLWLCTNELVEEPQPAYIIHQINHCLPTAPTSAVMVTVWLKQAAKRNCGINEVFSRLVIGREELFDLETEAEDRSTDSMYDQGEPAVVKLTLASNIKLLPLK